MCVCVCGGGGGGGGGGSEQIGHLVDKKDFLISILHLTFGYFHNGRSLDPVHFRDCDIWYTL